MPWTGERGGGFSPDPVEPWLPIGDPRVRNVADQRDDPGSILHLCRDLIELRRARIDLRTGPYASLDAPEGVWAWKRGNETVVAMNCSDVPVDTRFAGAIALGTEPSRTGERVRGVLRLEPWEAVVLIEEQSDGRPPSPS